MIFSYYKNRENMFGIILSTFILQTILLIIAIFTGEIDIIIIYLFFVFTSSIIIFFTRKILFCKVEINIIGIKIKYKNKIKDQMPWIEIEDIKKSFYLNTRNIIFISFQQKEIIVNANNKKIKKIISICPNTLLRKKLEQIKFII